MTTDKASSTFSRQLETTIKGHVCHCGESLHVAWLNGEYVTRCKNDHVNETMQRVKSWWQLYKEGQPIDPHIKQVFDRQEERRAKR